jgi:hypothetical protein
VLSNAGDHVPVTPSIEVAGKAVNASPEQIGATAVNEGITIGLTIMVIVVGIAHGPVTSGVNVYVVVVVLSNAGDHVPLIPSFDVVGKAANASPEQIGATAVNVGVVLGVIVIVIVVGTAH